MIYLRETKTSRRRRRISRVISPSLVAPPVSNPSGKNELFALISNVIHPHATHIFTLFLATLKRNKCLSSIPCYLGIPSFSSIPSYLPFPPLSPSPHQSERVCLWAFFAALGLSTVEVICSRGLSYNAHIKKFLQDAACARALVLSCCMGPNQRGSFCIAQL